MRKIFFITILILGYSVVSFAQVKKTALVKGRLIDSLTKKPLPDKRVVIKSIDVFTNSDGEGRFEFSEVPYGNQVVEVSGASVIKVLVSVNVDRDVVETGDIVVMPANPNANLLSEENAEIPTIAIDESNASTEDEGVSVQSAGGMMASTRDPFISALAFTFGAFWFQPRGSSRLGQEVQVNGVTLNAPETGLASWSQMGGLNNVFHYPSITYGLAPSNYTFGGVTGSTYYNATAADQRKGLDVSYQSTNRVYRDRIMATLNSGVMKNGWAYSFSFSRRWAQQGYIPGTFFDGYSYYAAVSKVIGKGQLNLTTFAAPTIRGRSGAATAEADSLDHSHYFNHYWGYQNGQVRNAVIQNTFQPITILNYEYRPSEKTRWNTAVGYEFGKDMRSSLFSYSADPSVVGDYYRNLPSYYLYGKVPANPSYASFVRKLIYNNPDLLQLKWDQMYNANYVNYRAVPTANGIIGDTVRGLESVYVQGNEVNDLKKFTFNTNIEHTVNGHLVVSGGLSFISQSTENYVQLADLLGGQFFVNYDQYAPQTSTLNGINKYAQYNLRVPNGIVKVGDRFYYDYYLRVNNGNLWGQAVYNLNKFAFFFSANGGNTSFYRDGVFQDGLFQNNSYGKSATHSFMTYGIKGGIDFKIDSRNLLFINAYTSATPPTPDNTYVSPRTRDYAVQNPTVQTNKSLEAGYFLKSKNFSIRLDGYVNDEINTTKIDRFYDDDLFTFVNYAMQGVNTRAIGTEASVYYKVYGHWSVSGAAAIGQSFYTNNPNISIYLDNDTTQHPLPSKVYIKNYYIGGGFQSAYTFAVNYRPKRFFATLNFNYMDRNYVQINPNRMTQAAAGYYVAGTPEWHAVFDQEKLPSAMTVDFHMGTSYQLSRRSKVIKKYSKDAVLIVNLSVNNILNNTDIINFGFEQFRYDFKHYQTREFPNKYIYAQAINYLLNVSLRF